MSKIKAKIKKLKEGDLLLVKWYDVNDLTAWQSPYSSTKITLALVATTGIFIEVDVNYDIDVVHLAHSIVEDGDRDGMVIPVLLIKSIEVLKKYKNF